MSNTTTKEGSIDDVLMVVNGDLLIEILSRLPTKSLHRFKCVSKPWNKSISHVISRRKTLLPMSGLFMNNVVNALNNPNCEQICRVLTSRLRNLPHNWNTDPLHSSNGLFLFTKLSDEYNLYHVWNPATDEFVSLPPKLPLMMWGAYCCLAFDPRESLHYKVIRLIFKHDTCDLVQIYSSMTGKWTEIIPPLTVPAPADSGPVFYKGAVYYLTQRPIGYHCCFNINNGTFHLIEHPYKYKRNNTLASRIFGSEESSCIGVSRGNLYHAVHFNARKELRIYVLDKGNNKWMLTHQNTALHNLGNVICEPVVFHPDSEIVYLNIRYKIAVYNPCSNILEAHGIGNSVHSRRVFPMTPLLESINPPGGKFISPSALGSYM